MNDARQEALPETWASREFPILREAARLIEANPPMVGGRAHEIAAATGLSDEQVTHGLRALEAEGLITVKWLMGAGAARVPEISGDARRILGTWPTPATALDRMIAALEQVAEHADDAGERSNARKFAAWLGSTSTTIGASVAAAVITGQLPH